MLPWFLAAVLVATASPPQVKKIEDLVASGRFESALAAIDALSARPDAAPTDAGEQLKLGKLGARCRFELGDYAGCEKELRKLLAGPARPGKPGHVECLAHLARALTFQDIHAEALKILDEAIRLHDAPSLRRLAITVLLRACRFEEILPHADALLERDPADAFAHFVRGIALSSKGRLEEALAELRWGLKMPGGSRDAHYQIAVVEGKLHHGGKALEHLLAIVEDDPYDQEACYQAALQLARGKSPASREAGAQLRRYFLTLKKAQGQADRSFPLEAEGLTAAAAILRASKWQRLGVYDRALEEIGRARAVARGSPEPFFFEADFWAGGGLLAEAEKALTRLPQGSREKAKAAARESKLRAALAKGMKKLAAQANTPLGKARLKVAQTPWRDARGPLEALLTEAVAAGILPAADRTARWLLARDPRSVRALAFLAERTATPSLLLPQIHYLTRLVRLLPDNRHYQEQLTRVRRTFLGKSP